MTSRQHHLPQKNWGRGDNLNWIHGRKIGEGTKSQKSKDRYTPEQGRAKNEHEGFPNDTEMVSHQKIRGRKKTSRNLTLCFCKASTWKT